ncbi:hypothetical protein [Celeribacter neptunius]|nr:hypothetical protein [Celeribacter neptunius]
MRWVLAVFWLFAGTIAASADTTEEMIARLQAQGYSEITTSRTWLGRVRIVAQRQRAMREIILDPRNGAILRDYIAETTEIRRDPSAGRAEDARPEHVPPPRNHDGAEDRDNAAPAPERPERGASD